MEEWRRQLALFKEITAKWKLRCNQTIHSHCIISKFTVWFFTSLGTKWVKDQRKAKGVKQSSLHMGVGQNSRSKEELFPKCDYFTLFFLFTLFCLPFMFRWWLCLILHQEILIANTYTYLGPDTEICIH